MSVYYLFELKMQGKLIDNSDTLREESKQVYRKLNENSNTWNIDIDKGRNCFVSFWNNSKKSLESLIDKINKEENISVSLYVMAKFENKKIVRYLEYDVRSDSYYKIPKKIQKEQIVSG